MAVSADGSRVAAASSLNTGVIYISTNAGGTWMKADVPDNDWNAIATSADGSRLVAVVKNTQSPGDPAVYTSTDSGRTWTPNDVPAGAWYAVSSSADGDKLAAVAVDGFSPSVLPVYISQNILSPVLSTATSNTNLAVSWIVPSTNFRLQQNPDLTTTNWTDVTNEPVLNLTNLHNEVILSPAGSSGFYRLMTR